MNYRQIVSGVDPRNGIATPGIPYQSYAGGYGLSVPEIDYQTAILKAALDRGYEDGQSAPLNEVLIRFPVQLQHWLDGEHFRLKPGNHLVFKNVAQKDGSLAAQNIRDFNRTMAKDYEHMRALADAPAPRGDIEMYRAAKIWAEEGEDALFRSDSLENSILTKNSWAIFRSVTMRGILKDFNFKGILLNISAIEPGRAIDANIAMQGPLTFQGADNVWGMLGETTHVGFLLTRKPVLDAKGAITGYGPFYLKPWWNYYPIPPASEPLTYLDNGGNIHRVHIIYTGVVHQSPYMIPSPRQISVTLGEFGDDVEYKEMYPPTINLALGTTPAIRKLYACS